MSEGHFKAAKLAKSVIRRVLPRLLQIADFIPFSRSWGHRSI